jgi:hypothetical protein
MNRKIEDLTGQKFGKMTVLGRDTDIQSRRTYWMCQCECGTIKSCRADSLKDGSIVSCGCRKREQGKTNLTKHHTHKQSGTRLYYSWQDMKKRCYNEGNSRYANYGGRGIKVCDEWKDNFTAFYQWAIENGYSEKLTIDRINVDGDYEPSNCRWADIKTQCNNRTSNIKITIGNSTRTLTEWCEIFNVDYKKINARYRRNGFVSIDDLFNS